MVRRKWLRAGLFALVLYIVCAAVIGYFGLNAYSGNRSLRAKQEIEEQTAQLNDELAVLRAERATWDSAAVSTCSTRTLGEDGRASLQRASRFWRKK